MPSLTDDEAARVLQSAFRGRQARMPPNPRFTMTLVVRCMTTSTLTLASGRGMPDPYLRISVAEGPPQPSARTRALRSNVQPAWPGAVLELLVAPCPLILIELLEQRPDGQDIVLGFRRLRLLARRGRVPHLDLYSTADYPDQVNVSFEYDTFQGLEKMIFSKRGGDASDAPTAKESDNASGRGVMERQAPLETTTRLVRMSTSLAKDVKDHVNPSETMLRMANLDEKAGMIVVLGESGPLKSQFCMRLAQRLRGSVISIAVVDSNRSATNKEKAAFVRRTLKTMAWPRILIDFAQTRAELSALEGTGTHDARVLVAIQMPQPNNLQTLVQANVERNSASWTFHQDGRRIPLPFNTSWTEETCLRRWANAVTQPLRRAGFPVPAIINQHQAATALSRRARSFLTSVKRLASSTHAFAAPPASEGNEKELPQQTVRSEHTAQPEQVMRADESQPATHTRPATGVMSTSKTSANRDRYVPTRAAKTFRESSSYYGLSLHARTGVYHRGRSPKLRPASARERSSRSSTLGPGLSTPFDPRKDFLVGNALAFLPAAEQHHLSRALEAHVSLITLPHRSPRHAVAHPLQRRRASTWLEGNVPSTFESSQVNRQRVATLRRNLEALTTPPLNVPSRPVSAVHRASYPARKGYIDHSPSIR